MLRSKFGAEWVIAPTILSHTRLRHVFTEDRFIPPEPSVSFVFTECHCASHVGQTHVIEQIIPAPASSAIFTSAIVSTSISTFIVCEALLMVFRITFLRSRPCLISLPMVVLYENFHLISFVCD
ncbi:MAG: hypothetical protein CM1200mP3_04860 [Chloroflexota bacterium]|nr:MAG: hypothetical protein CM1200mP3_04860 [Chloroflexota bacterium]